MPDLATAWGLDHRAFRKIVVGIFLGIVMFLIPAPDDAPAPDDDGDGTPDYATLTTDGKNTLALFALIVYFWATEALPLPVTALCAGVGLVLLGIADDPNDAWSPYAQDTIFFLLGSLILADAVTKTDTDRVLAARFLRKVGGSTDSLLFGIVAVSAISAAFISNHAVAAVMLPLVISILRSTGLYQERNVAAAYILAIATGAGIAGLATPSGGSRNIIVLGYLDDLYGVKISYLEWTIHAAPITLALIPVTFLMLKFAFRIPHRRISDGVPDEEGGLNAVQRRTLVIMLLTVVLWITLGTRYGLGTIAIVGAVLMFVTGILDWVDTRTRIAWGVPLIYGAALAMGEALNETGAAGWLAVNIRGMPIWTTPTALLVGTLVITVVLTNIMSDGGTAAVLAPVTLSLAALLAYPGFGVAEMGLITAIGASFGFLLVVANPGNVITYSSGLFTPRDLMKVGVPLTLASLAVTWAAVEFYWPMLGGLS